MEFKILKNAIATVELSKNELENSTNTTSILAEYSKMIEILDLMIVEVVQLKNDAKMLLLTKTALKDFLTTITGDLNCDLPSDLPSDMKAKKNTKN